MQGVIAALLGASLACAAGMSWDWHQTLAPHFEVKHEAAFMPGGFTIQLERLHSRLRLDLGMFSPWMSKERLKLFLYSGRQSYSAGEFDPPSWSNGISIYDRRIVAVYDQADRAKLMAVISHETTHLLFESYWSELGRRPPSWLNEGLAMVEEGEREKPESSDWFQAMLALPPRERVPLGRLVTISPTQDLRDDEGQVTAWYIQSYSLVYFLLRRQSRLQFKAFCGALRDGRDIDTALWLSYRLKGVAGLEKAWLAWLQSSEMRAKSRLQFAPAASAQEAPKSRRIGAIKGFKPLEPPRRQP